MALSSLRNTKGTLTWLLLRKLVSKVIILHSGKIKDGQKTILVEGHVHCGIETNPLLKQSDTIEWYKKFRGLFAMMEES